MFNLMLLGGIDGKGVRVPTPWCFPGQRTQPRKTVRGKSTQISKRLWKHKIVIEKRNCAGNWMKIAPCWSGAGWHTDTLFGETINMTWHDLLAGRRPPPPQHALLSYICTAGFPRTSHGGSITSTCGGADVTTRSPPEPSTPDHWPHTHMLQEERRVITISCATEAVKSTNFSMAI